MRERISTGLPADPLWYKDAVIYELHVRAFYDSDGDGIGDFRGLTQQARLPRGPRRHRHLAAAVLPLAARDDGYDIADYTRVHPAYGTLRDFQALPPRGAPARPARHHRAGPQPHLRPAPVVPARAPRPARLARARLLRLERHAREVQRRAHHLQGLRALELDLGPGRQRVLLAPLLLPPARPELRQPRGPRGDRCGSLDFWLEMGVDGLRLDAVPYLYEREGTNCENLPETHAFLQAAARARRRAASATGCCSPRRTSGRRTRSPTSATATSATWPSTSRSCRGCSWRCAWRTASRSSTSSSRRPAIPENSPVGDVPAQPRRADARDGHRRGARLHVPRLRRTTRRRASTSASAAASRRCSATTAGASS